MSHAESGGGAAPIGSGPGGPGAVAIALGVALALAALATLPWWVHGHYDPVIRTGDGAVYLLTAQSLLAGEGYSYLGEPFVIRPPGFSFLLAPVLHLFGDDLYAVNWFVSLLGVAAAVALYAFYRERLGRWGGAALAVVAWLHPSVRSLSNEVLSDVPAIAALFGCLLVERWARRRPGVASDLALGLCIGAAGYLRTLLLVLAPAVVLARALTRDEGPRGRLVAGLAALLFAVVLVQAPWWARNAAVERATPTEHTLFYSYWVAMWHTDIGDPTSPRIGWDAFRERVSQRVGDVSRELNGRAKGGDPGWAHPGFTALAIACWGVVLVRRREAAEIFFGLALALQLVYFGFAYRLVLPLYLLALPCVAEVALVALGRFGSPLRAQGAVAVALLALALVDAAPRAGWAGVARRQAVADEVVEVLRDRFGTGDRIAADFGGHLSFQLGRPIHTLRWSTKRGGQEAALDFIERYRIDGVVLDTRRRSGRVLRPVLEPRYGCAAEVGEHVCIVEIPRRTRIVLISLDTLRADSLGGGAGGTAEMPHTLARARAGLRFDRCYAATSITQPTHATVLTGLHPWQHGVTRNGQVLAPEFETITERLAAAGFYTAAVVASFPLASRFGFSQGFVDFQEDFSRDFRRRKVWEQEWEIEGGRFFSGAEEITERALAAIDGASGDRQFFWFHYFDPHTPYGDSQGESLGYQQILARVKRGGEVDAIVERARALYRADVEYLDASLARVFARLDEEADRFATHLVVISDHGESLGEDHSVGHGFRIPDEQIRIPCFVASPRVASGVRNDVASTVDVARTVLSLAGVEAPTALEGRDWTDPRAGSSGALGMRRTFAGDPPEDLRLDGRVHELPPYLFYAVDAEGRTARGNAKGLVDAESTGAGSGRLRALFAALEEEVRAGGAAEVVSPEVEAALEALGYAR